MNQHLLNSLGVGHPSIDKVIKIANDYGYPAKLTGGGGGGCVVIFLNKRKLTLKLTLSYQWLIMFYIF